MMPESTPMHPGKIRFIMNRAVINVRNTINPTIPSHAFGLVRIEYM